jgi:hypothetical protein
MLNGEYNKIKRRRRKKEKKKKRMMMIRVGRQQLVDVVATVHRCQ